MAKPLTKSKPFSVRLPVDVFDVLSMRAKREGLSTSSLAQDLLVEALTSRPARAPLPAPEPQLPMVMGCAHGNVEHGLWTDTCVDCGARSANRGKSWTK